MADKTRVLILGGGFGGLYAALEFDEIPRGVHLVQTIQRKLRSRGAKTDGVVAE